jgi:hypothetical protein
MRMPAFLSVPAFSMLIGVLLRRDQCGTSHRVCLRCALLILLLRTFAFAGSAAMPTAANMPLIEPDHVRIAGSIQLRLWQARE